MVNDAQITARLQELLAEVDWAETSERKLREKLQEEFDVDLSEKKALVRAEVKKYLLEHPVPEDERADDEGDKDDDDSQEANEHVEENEDEVETGSPRSKRKQNKRQQPAGEETRVKKPRVAGKKSKPKAGKGDDNGKEKTGKGRGGQGFSKPMKVSTELADFLGLGEISRPELTKFMWSYFKNNGLQNPANKQEIICDEKLRALMNVDRFRGFGFMKHLKHHIVQN